MRAPSFMQLARIDGRRFITACRHGLVHLTWGRATVRFSRDDFRRLAGLVERAADALPPATLSDGDLRATFRQGEDSELQVGALVLLLEGGEFQAFAIIAREAVRQLDRFLTSGGWDRDESDEGPPDILQQLSRTPFSMN